jgi:multiple sugar transport system permease protein
VLSVTQTEPVQRGRGPAFQWSTALLLAPAGLLLLALFLVPVGYSVYLAFTNLSLIGPTAINYQFTGLANVVELIQDPVFWQSTAITVIFVAGAGAFGVTAAGMVLALLMRPAPAWLRTVVGAVVVVAWMLPPVTAAIIWYAFSTAGGTLAVLLGNPNADYLSSAPLLMVCLANIWSTAGFAMLILSAALRNIPQEVEEAVALENVSGWSHFWGVTFPMIRPTVVTTVLLVSLLSLANFTLIWLMTAGGPGNATDILPVYSYQQAFVFDRLAYGSLISVVMVLFSSVLGIFYVRSSRTVAS